MLTPLPPELERGNKKFLAVSPNSRFALYRTDRPYTLKLYDNRSFTSRTLFAEAVNWGTGAVNNHGEVVATDTRGKAHTWSRSSRASVPVKDNLKYVLSLADDGAFLASTDKGKIPRIGQIGNKELAELSTGSIEPKTSCRAMGISPDGRRIVGFKGGAGDFRPLRWERDESGVGEPTEVATPSGHLAAFFAVDNQGTAVGLASTGSLTEPNLVSRGAVDFGSDPDYGKRYACYSKLGAPVKSLAQKIEVPDFRCVSDIRTDHRGISWLAGWEADSGPAGPGNYPKGLLVQMRFS